MKRRARAVSSHMAEPSDQVHSVNNCFCGHGSARHRYEEIPCNCLHAPNQRAPHKAHRLTLCDSCDGVTGQPDKLPW